MFAIHTLSGTSFSGPLEQLRRVEKSAEANPTRFVLNGENDQQATSDDNPGHYAIEQYRHFLREEKQREPVYHAYQIMSTAVQLLQAQWPLPKAIEKFRQYPYQVMPVVNDRRALVGVVSRRGLYEFILMHGIPNAKETKTVAECFLSADSKVYSANPVTDVRRITTLLVEKNLEALPIAEETGRVVGIVSRTDILRCAVADPPLSLWC